MQMVRTPSGEFTANIAEMDEAIRAAWAPVNRRYEASPEPSVDKFMQEYRHHVRHSAMKARMLTGDVLLQRARKMGVKAANGPDLWSISLLKRLPTPFWDALAELLRMVERTGQWPDRVAEGFTSLVPKGEGGGDPMKLRPLTVLSQIYRIWAGVRMEDALQWQEQWIHPEAYGFRPHRGAIDAATVLTLLVELAQALKTPLVGAGTDYTKCFDLIPQAISMAPMEEQGIDEGVLRAFSGMYRQLRRMFKIKGCLGAWWAATNGVLQGCPLSVIVINALTTTWKRIIDDVGEPVVVTTKEMPPAPKEEEIPSCYWTSYGTGLDQIWVWRCVQPCCCWEQGWVVDGEHAPPPNPDNGGDVQPPRRPDGCRPGLPTPAEKVWGRLGLLAVPTPASTEHSRASLRSPPLAGGRMNSRCPARNRAPRSCPGTFLAQTRWTEQATARTCRRKDQWTKRTRHQDHGPRSQQKATRTTRTCLQRTSCPCWRCSRRPANG